jgi:hypothetical protein
MTANQPEEQRIDQLDEDIERTRDVAEEAGVIDDPDEPKFYESSELSDIDDQAIQPPG